MGLRLYPDLEAAVDAAIEAQPDPKPSRPDMIRTLLAEALRARGLFPKP